MPTDSKKPRIFLSYARSDGQEFARQLFERLSKEGLSIWFDRREMEGGKDWWKQIVEALETVEYLLLVMTPNAVQSNIVSKEWRLARQKGVGIVPIIGAPALNLSNIPGWMGKTHFVDPSISEEWNRLLRTLEAPPNAVRIPFLADDLPSDFVARPEEFERLVNNLLTVGPQQPVAITAALKGAGGYGKTTLAKAVCHDERIQEQFSDGILWITLGKDPGDPTRRIEDLIYVLTNKRPGFATIEPALAFFSNLIEDRELLIVVDDVWNLADAAPFLHGGPRCARLITTRDQACVPRNARSIPVDAMKQSEALALLAAKLPEDNVSILQELCARLGEWPLLLKLVNGVLLDRVASYGQALPDAVSFVNKALSKHGLRHFDDRNPRQRDQAVSATLAVSLETLSGEERARFVELAIFPEDTEIPLSTVANLWLTTAELDSTSTEDLCVRLHRCSLLLHLDFATQTIRLHDVIRLYLLESVRERLRDLHAAFLDGYKCAHWADLPSIESYLWKFHAYHMVHAGRSDELTALSFSFRYLYTKLTIVGAQGIIEDLELLDDLPELVLLKGAIQLSDHVISKEPSQLASQLIGRLLGETAPSLQALIEQAQSTTTKTWLRPLTRSLRRPGGPLRTTLIGNRGEIHALTITPDGRVGASASRDGSLRVWDLDRGIETASLTSQGDRVEALAITADGKTVVFALTDGTIHSWHVHERLNNSPCAIGTHHAWVHALAITPNGKHAISASADRTIRIWELRNGAQQHCLCGHEDAVIALTLSHDTQHLLSASRDGIVKIWNLSNWLETASFSSGYSSAKIMFLDAEPDCITIGYSDGTIVRKSTKDTRELSQTRIVEGSIKAISTTPNRRLVVSASANGNLQIWDPINGEKLHTLYGHRKPVPSVALGTSSSCLLSGSRDRTIKVWDLSAARLAAPLNGHTGAVLDICFTPDGLRAITASQDRTLKVWEVHTGQEITSLKGHQGAVRRILTSPLGDVAISASNDGRIKLWDLSTYGELFTFEGHRGYVEALALTPDGTCLLSASEDSTIRVWDIFKRIPVASLTGHSRSVDQMMVSDGGQIAISASQDQTLRIWDLEGYREVGTIAVGAKPHEGWLETVNGTLVMAVTRNSDTAVTASMDGVMRVWDLRSRTLLFTLKGHRNLVNRILITSDGQRAISSSNDGTVKIWSLRNGQEVRTLRGHEGRIVLFALDQNEHMMITTSQDETVKVWDILSGLNIASFQADAATTHCAFSKDGLTIIIGDALGQVHFLRLQERASSG